MVFHAGWAFTMFGPGLEIGGPGARALELALASSNDHVSGVVQPTHTGSQKAIALITSLTGDRVGVFASNAAILFAVAHGKYSNYVSG